MCATDNTEPVRSAMICEHGGRAKIVHHQGNTVPGYVHGVTLTSTQAGATRQKPPVIPD